MAEKRVSVTVFENGKKSVVEMEVDEELLKPVEDFWCECQEPTESDFWDDEFDEDGNLLSKHHYTCRVCGKVTQIG